MMRDLAFRFRGMPVQITDVNGMVHEGIIEGVSSDGVFLRSRFNRRFFLPFFLIFSLFLLRRRRF